jgi:hypothetical protein
MSLALVRKLNVLIGPMESRAIDISRELELLEERRAVLRIEMDELFQSIVELRQIVSVLESKSTDSTPIRPCVSQRSSDFPLDHPGNQKK